MFQTTNQFYDYHVVIIGNIEYIWIAIAQLRSAHRNSDHDLM